MSFAGNRCHLPQSDTVFPMTNTGVETLAIVDATFAEVDARHSAIQLRMWHHCPPHAQREMLMASFPCTDHRGTFVQAFLAAVRAHHRGAWPALRPPAGLTQQHLPMLERAFTGALEDVLGQTAVPMVMNAWTEMVRAFLRELCRNGCVP